MKKKLPWVLSGLALIAFIGLTFKTVMAFNGLSVAGQPIASGQPITGMGGDGYPARWTSYYGYPALSQSNWMYETSTGLGVGTTTPGATLTVNGTGAQFDIAGSTAVVIGVQGHFEPRQYLNTTINTLVPDGIGAVIEDINGSFPYNLCIATGTAAAQWFAVIQSTGGTNGGGTHQSGCGSLN